MYHLFYNKSISFDVAVIHRIMLCHKNCMTSHGNILMCTGDVTDNDCVDNVCPYCNNVHLLLMKGIKSHIKGSNDIQNLTQMVILYEIYETRKGSFHKLHMK